METSNYEIVGIFGNKVGNLKKVTSKYFQSTDGAKYLRDIHGGQYSIKKKKSC